MNLDIASDLATILTAVIAAGAWFQFQWERHQRRTRLERHLRRARDPNGNPATVAELVVDLGMGENDILDAAFRSKRIRRCHRVEGASGRTVAVELEYAHDPPERF